MENDLFPLLQYDSSDCFWEKHHHQPHPPPPPPPATELTAHFDSVADRSFVVRKLGGVDPGFADRAARLSYFAAGSRSFNARAVPAAASLPRVLSSPSLKELGPSPNSLDESTISEQRIASETPNPRKRKASSRPKPKELPIPNSTKGIEIDENHNNDSNAKRSKVSEGNGDENGNSSGDDQKPAKDSPKPLEPMKDYIHVRARRGQATDSHSLAERVRREKISERMKLLQDLVPGCNKVTGKALMLDEIINYVQSLQRQVEFLSMKLSSVNTRLDGNTDTLMSKDVYQLNNSMAHPIFPLDSSAQSIFGHQPHQNQAIHNNDISSGPMNHCPIDGLDLQFPQLNAFTDIISQYPFFGEDDLQSIVQMGFGQHLSRDSSLQPQNIQGQNQVPHMKIEL